jgi:hypothetical protein
MQQISILVVAKPKKTPLFEARYTNGFNICAQLIQLVEDAGRSSCAHIVVSVGCECHHVEPIDGTVG